MTLFLQNMEKSAPSDPELLADWLSQQREPAFHALVARYAGLVHAAARRTCGDESMAAEASQLTFIALAHKARTLTSCNSLGGWLHLTAMMQAKNLLRKSQRETRKRQRLQSAMETEPPHASNDAWKEIQPVLDDALAALSEKDREALLLRFYRSLTIREIAATLGIATDAAQKRIDRATERLRGKLTRRGVQSGGTFVGTLVAGFSADAQAALPVSILASKAIAAAGATSIGGLALFASIATLMKTSPWIPPVVAMLVAGVWTGTKYQSLATVEAANARTRDQIALAQTSRTSTPGKTPNDEASINWQRLATEEENGPEMQRLVRLMQSMTRDEMIDTLDRITLLECSKARRNELESVVVVSPLGQIDPEWVLNRFQDRLGDEGLPLHWAFGNWVGKDLAEATAWLDAQVTAGNLNSKRLDDDNGNQPRNRFEATLINVLLASDPAAADRRLDALPENQRVAVISSMTNGMSNRVLNEPLTEGNHLAFANLVRSQLPTERQAPILADCVPYFWGTEEFPKFNAYMDVIEATSAERIACAEDFFGNHIRMLSNKRKVSLEDLEVLRGHFAEISPRDVDVMTARTLAEAVKGRNSSMMFPQASALAVELLEASGSDDVLATFLVIAPFDKRDINLGRELAGKISDEARRAEILKRFD